MSLHSYSRCWLHLTWCTLERNKILPRRVRVELSRFLGEYAHSKAIQMCTNFVCADHVHVLIDLPTDMTIAKVINLLKGASSHWINEQQIMPFKLEWGRGYGAFSVSPSALAKVIKYIAEQEEHHRTKSFLEEYEESGEKGRCS